LSALDTFDPGSLIGKARFEVEVNIRQCVNEINLNPTIHNLLTELTRSSKASIPYNPGEEAALRTVLGVLHKALEKMEQAEKQGAQQAVVQRKADLLAAGKQALAAGEGTKAKIELRKLAEEFGKEPGVLAQIGNMFVAAKLPRDAAEFLEMAIEAFPKEAKEYGTLVECYMGGNEYEKAEAVYLKVLKNLGQHPKTLTNLAKVYKLEGKRQKAAETAQRALSMDPKNAAKVIRSREFHAGNALQNARNTQQACADHGQKARHIVIQHDPEASRQPVFRSVHRPGLGDVEETKKDKGGDHKPRRRVRKGEQRQPHAGHFVQAQFRGVVVNA